MKNTSQKTASISDAKKSRRIIQLDPSQYALYNSGQIDIHSPEGEHLTSVGVDIDRIEAGIARSRLLDQMSLVEALVVTSTGELQLSDFALAGLADMLNSAQQQLR